MLCAFFIFVSQSATDFQLLAKRTCKKIETGAVKPALFIQFSQDRRASQCS